MYKQTSKAIIESYCTVSYSVRFSAIVKYRISALRIKMHHTLADSVLPPRAWKPDVCDLMFSFAFV